MPPKTGPVGAVVTDSGRSSFSNAACDSARTALLRAASVVAAPRYTRDVQARIMASILISAAKNPARTS